MRTFALAGLLGGVSALLGPAVLAVGVAFVGAATLAGYLRAEREDAGLTTEVALVLCVLLGALAIEEPALAAGLGVGVTMLLAWRECLHRLTRDTLTEQELRDALLFAAAALIVLPLLPSRPIGPNRVLNPTAVWRLVVVVLAINGVGYVALRVLGARRALPLAGFFGGFVSGAPTVGAMGSRSRADQRIRRPAVAGAVATVVLTALVADGRLDPAAAVAPVLAGFATSSVTKTMLAFTLGGRRFGLAVGAGLAVVLAAAWAGWLLF